MANRKPHARTKSKTQRRKNPKSESWRNVVILDTEIQDALARPSDFGYSGDQDMFATWSLGPIIDHRDATILAKSNKKALLQALEAHPEFEESWELTHASHWAVGWVDHISFMVLDSDGRPTDIFKFLNHWFNRLEDLPMADEDLYTEMQMEAFDEQWEMDLQELKRKLRDDIPDDWADQVYEKLFSEHEYEYDEQDVPYFPEQVMEEVAMELGFIDEEEMEANPAPPTNMIFTDHEGFFVGGNVLAYSGDRRTILLYEPDTRTEILASIKENPSGSYWVLDTDPSTKYRLVQYTTPRHPQRAENIGPGLGGFLGTIAGGTVSSVFLSALGTTPSFLILWWTLSSLGSAAGAYLAADEESKRNAAIGAGVGNLIVPFIGSAIGGWIGGGRKDPTEVQEKRKRAKRERARASNAYLGDAVELAKRKKYGYPEPPPPPTTRRRASGSESVRKVKSRLLK